MTKTVRIRQNSSLSPEMYFYMRAIVRYGQFPSPVRAFKLFPLHLNDFSLCFLLWSKQYLDFKSAGVLELNVKVKIII